MSSVFAARSLNHGRAMTGTRWLAEMWPLCELMSSSDMSALSDASLCVCIGEVCVCIDTNEESPHNYQ